MASCQRPDVGPTFNLVHDWFDAFARGDDRPAGEYRDGDFPDLDNSTPTNGKR
ncbi:hypothetical protein H4696_003258 [Amycolatopsis lexingtonensis]|uniref:Uncharacterized protein n=1 Tax=Amycolatopsis lexingtonensis TaxID=218822 RepID=A0ABR9HZ05_9PSEU|nr:hypothetical protein [Amycolatopsis lexingtonensis]MBE1496158.1 hypothetical protein [Amycolatopsis lexingtonensis]